MLLPTLRSWAVQASWNEWVPRMTSWKITILNRRYICIQGLFFHYLPWTFVSFQGTVSFRTLSHVSFLDRRNVMKCCPPSLHFLLFVSMEGDKFERQRCIIKSLHWETKRCVKEVSKASGLRFHWGPTPWRWRVFCLDAILPAIYHSMLWKQFQWKQQKVSGTPRLHSYVTH